MKSSSAPCWSQTAARNRGRRFISLVGLSFFGRDVHMHGFSVPLPTPEEFGPGGQDEKSGNSRMCERGVPLHPGERGGR
jgi:hypothetical protein